MLFNIFAWPRDITNDGHKSLRGTWLVTASAGSLCQIFLPCCWLRESLNLTMYSWGVSALQETGVVVVDGKPVVVWTTVVVMLGGLVGVVCGSRVGVSVLDPGSGKKGTFFVLSSSSSSDPSSLKCFMSSKWSDTAMSSSKDVGFSHHARSSCWSFGSAERDIDATTGKKREGQSRLSKRTKGERERKW